VKESLQKLNPVYKKSGGGLKVPMGSRARNGLLGALEINGLRKVRHSCIGSFPKWGGDELNNRLRVDR